MMCGALVLACSSTCGKGWSAAGQRRVVQAVAQHICLLPLSAMLFHPSKVKKVQNSVVEAAAGCTRSGGEVKVASRAGCHPAGRLPHALPAGPLARTWRHASAVGSSGRPMDTANCWSMKRTVECVSAGVGR